MLSLIGSIQPDPFSPEHIPQSARPQITVPEPEHEDSDEEDAEEIVEKVDQEKKERKRKSKGKTEGKSVKRKKA
jgi:DNA-directed RNA polymerase I subunit RPA43